MQETLKYIKVLNWGYGGFAPMTLTPDYKESLEQVRERLGLLESLNYDALLREAISPEGKEYLAKYTKTDSTFEYGLRFLRDKEAILNRTNPDWLPEYLEVAEKAEDGKTIYTKIKNPYKYNGLQALKDGADMFTFGCLRSEIEPDKVYKGVWSEEQWQEYIGYLGAIEKGFEERLRQFAAAYDYPLSADDPEQQPEPQQEQKKTTRGKGRPKETLRDKVAGNDPEFIDKLHTLIDGKKGKDFALYIRACVDLGKITKPTYKQVAEEFGDIGHKSGYNKYMNGQLYSYEEIKGAENQILSL